MSKNLFVTQIDLSLADRLRRDLVDQGFTLTEVPHTLVAGKKNGVSCILYGSGKLVVQGRATLEFVEFYIEPSLLGQTGLMQPAVDLEPRIGTDEAGKGDYFGPLCIAGVYADGQQIQGLLQLGVTDSKLLTDRRAADLSRKIQSLCSYDVLVLKPTKYNELYGRFKNLNRLLAWAHSAVIANLHERTSCGRALVDQFEANGLLEAAVLRKVPALQLTQRPKAESDVVVAAASILARAAFLKGLTQLGESVGIQLPKGAYSGIHEAGRKLLATHGPEILGSVAKLHFKTTQELLG